MSLSQGALRLGIVGRGRAAGALGPLLESLSRVQVTWQWSHADDADPGRLPEVDVVLLAVPDGAIEDAAARMSGRRGARREIWLHLSGSRPGRVARFGPDIPAAAGCLHPLVALRPGCDAEHLRGATAGVDGDPAAVTIAEELAEALGMVPRCLDPAHKPLYHAAAVSVAGHAVALMRQGMDMLNACGFTDEDAQAALLPLMRGAIDNLKAGSPKEQVTGPAARGDRETVAKHLRALNAHGTRLKTPAATYALLAKTCEALSGP